MPTISTARTRRSSILVKLCMLGYPDLSRDMSLQFSFFLPAACVLAATCLWLSVSLCLLYLNRAMCLNERNCLGQGRVCTPAINDIRTISCLQSFHSLAQPTSLLRARPRAPKEHEMIRHILSFFRRRDPRNQIAEQLRTCCGTPGIYTGELKLRPEIIARIDAKLTQTQTVGKIQESP